MQIGGVGAITTGGASVIDHRNANTTQAVSLVVMTPGRK
jgi:hypothetical protein